WSFEFESQPYFSGFHVLASNGLTLPVFNVFRMFSKMRGNRVGVESNGAVSLDDMIANGVRGAAPDVSAFASISPADRSAYVMAWNYHDDDLPAVPSPVDIVLQKLPANGATLAHIEHYRIDNDHSNVFEAWKRLGSPQQPSQDQRATLEAASQLATLEDSAQQ